DLALRQGKRVDHVYATRGEGGGNMVGRQSGRALGMLREAELRACLGQMGVRRCWFLDREDFAYTESLAVTLEKWGHEETLERLVRVVRSVRPEVVLTMNPAPSPGQHGNHQAAGWLAVEAFDVAADPDAFPAQLKREGLRPWRPRKLYFGGAGPFMAVLPGTNALADGRIPARIAGEALALHRSQGFGNIGSAPWFLRPQRLQLVKSVVSFEPEESDVFRGLPVPGDVPPRVSASSPRRPAPPVKVRFLPRRAVSRYEEWVEEQGIGAAATTFDPDVPVVAGEATPVPLEIVDPPGSPKGRLRLQAPPGWTVQPRELDVGVAAQPEWFRIVQVEAPTGGGDATLVAAGDIGGQPVRAEVRLHVVPRLEIVKVAPPGLGTDVADAAWRAIPAIDIPHTNTWQGTVTNAADVSAAFRAAHDGANLWVEVRVVDDVVVSNIAPDDIKGHWRSDSVEVCVDPEGGAEHTLGTFKVGVFPFDAAGKARGARDADREPGLIDETAPGMGLVSARTRDGYLVRMRIPWAVAGVDVGKGGRLGFNVLVYDGDKAEAAPGENINRSRLAWAPRSGVQGRPEDWGRAVLGR
ncbi:MAG: sugar-binding protein, partial [Verrucomicrobiota bacterium]